MQKNEQTNKQTKNKTKQKQKQKDISGNTTQEPQDLNCALSVHQQICCDKLSSFAVKNWVIAFPSASIPSATVLCSIAYYTIQLV